MAAVKRLLEEWRVLTPEGARTWHAEDRAHALEQHADAFPAESPAWTIGPAQEAALADLCARYDVAYDPAHYRPGGLGLPAGYVAGWIGGPDARKLFVGCDPEGRISS